MTQSATLATACSGYANQDRYTLTCVEYVRVILHCRTPAPGTSIIESHSTISYFQMKAVHIPFLCAIACAVSTFPSTSIAQTRDLRSERIVIDDDNADGNGIHTLTMQAPNPLSQNSILTIPNPGGAAANVVLSESATPQTINAYIIFGDTVDLTGATVLGFTSGWSLTGNAATGTDVLGTSNAEDLRFITANSLRMTIDDATGNIGIGTAPSATDRLDVGGTINTSDHYSIGGERLLSIPGTGNLFVGIESGDANTSGTANTFLGAAAGKANTTGFNNVYIGHEAGAAGDTVVNNTMIGYRSGFANTVGGENTFVGNLSGAGNTSGSANTFIGSNAGIANTTGMFNTFVGIGAGASNGTAEENTFIGATAGQFNTSGELNTFVGVEAGRLNSSGTGNTFVGAFAGDSNTTGGANAFYGRQAGFGNTTGGSNTFLGAFSGQRNKTGLGNTFVGTDAGRSQDIADENTFIGVSAGFVNTQGNRNAFLGAASGAANLTGDDNTFIGYRAANSTTTGDSNTVIGLQAGFTNVSGSTNTFLGALADVAGAAMTNATAIGARAQAGQSNSIILGSISGINGATEDVTVGIGTTTPTQKLEVRNGNILLSNSGTAAELHLAEPGGTDYTALTAQAQSGNITYTLPAINGSAGQVLTIASLPAPTASTATLTWSPADGPNGVLTRITTGVNYAMASTDEIVGVTAGSVTVTLPAANSVPVGKTIIIKREGAGGGNVTVSRAGTDGVDGGTSVAVGDYGTARLYSDGVGTWYTW